MKKFYLLVGLLIYGGLLSAQTSLIVQDTRSTSTTPSTYEQSFQAHFKYGSAIGLPDVYYTILGLRGWTSDNSGGKAHELAFSSNGPILFRSGYSPTWDSWRKLVITDVNGNVGIGIDNTQGYKLAVAGNMIAESVKVKLQSAWPDYVFSKSYELPSLQSTEQHIKEKGHLPGIPSAAEVKANGVDLGEMNAKLLQKIEEITLYLIEIKKEAKSQKELIEIKNEQLRKEIDELKSKVK